jgi:hypothetical protein
MLAILHIDELPVLHTERPAMLPNLDPRLIGVGQPGSLGTSLPLDKPDSNPAVDIAPAGNVGGVCGGFFLGR